MKAKYFSRLRKAERIHQQQTYIITYSEESPSIDRRMTEAESMNMPQEMESTGNDKCVSR